MVRRDSAVSEIKIGPSLMITAVSVVIGILVDAFIKGNFGRASFLSSLMVMLAFYSCRDSLRNRGITVYLVAYSLAHACFTLLYGGILERLPGSMLIFIAIVDYVIFFFGANIFYRI